MSLLQNLSFKEYQNACSFGTEQCEVIAQLADLQISFDDTKRPGELLMKKLDRRGFSVQQYRQFLSSAFNTRTISYYRPQTKIAILIANDKYEYLSKLVTPSIDCEALAVKLKKLGFIILIIINQKSNELKKTLARILEVIPENSYCFIFYAGHGCELVNTKCILGIDCPTENIELSHCVTENWLLSEVAKCKPELCVLIMDMCRLNLDREANPKIYSLISTIEAYTVYSNLLIGYSTQASQSAYEMVQIECYTTIGSETYHLKTDDDIVPCASQYVNALCARLMDNLDVSHLMDKVHADVENSMKRQRPIKVQCGVAKRALYDPTKENTPVTLNKLKQICEEYHECCTILS